MIKPEFEKRYRKLLGERYEEFIEISKTYLRKSIRVNTLKTTVNDVKKRMKEWSFEPVPWCEEGFFVEHKNKRRDIGNLLEHTLGYIYVQEAASMIPPVVLDPKPGDIALDMCASPGSKSTQLAQYMKNQGVLFCNDVNAGRMAPLDINLQRCGVRNSVITLMPGRVYSGTFDKVLVDAPCSGTGAIRKSFKTFEIWNPDMIKRLSATQKQLIKTGYRILCRGGTLVYSTCSVEPEENEEVVQYLLDNTDAKLEKINLDINPSPNIKSFQGKTYPDIDRTLRIWPQDNNTEGFFVAKIKKP